LILLLDRPALMRQRHEAAKRSRPHAPRRSNRNA
jgi:hypothetical protein